MALERKAQNTSDLNSEPEFYGKGRRHRFIPSKLMSSSEESSSDKDELPDYTPVTKNKMTNNQCENEEDLLPTSNKKRKSNNYHNTNEQLQIDEMDVIPSCSTKRTKLDYNLTTSTPVSKHRNLNQNQSNGAMDINEMKKITGKSSNVDYWCLA